MKKTISLLFSLFLMASLIAESWQKQETRDKWGDVDGFSYVQYAFGEHHAYGKTKSSNVVCMYLDNGVLTLTEQVSSLAHPGLELREGKTIKVSFRIYSNTNKDLRANSEQILCPVLKSPTYDSVSIAFPHTLRAILQTLDEQQVMQLLIEGENWYTRIDLHGGLPHIENETQVDTSGFERMAKDNGS